MAWWSLLIIPLDGRHVPLNSDIVYRKLLVVVIWVLTISLLRKSSQVPVKMHKLQVIPFFLLVSVAALGQGSIYYNQVRNSSGTLVSGATVRICQAGATGTPCMPLATIYTNQTLTTTASNPLTSDSSGNFTFGCASGFYQVQISGSGLTTNTYTVPCGIAQGANGAALSLNNIQFADQFPGADAGAKITACLAALSLGGTCDARGLSGPSSGAGFSVGDGTKPEILLLGQLTFTASSGITVNANSIIQCAGPGISVIKAGSGVTDKLLTIAGNNSQVKGCTLDGVTIATNNIFVGDNVTNFVIDGNECTATTATLKNADCISVTSESNTSTGKILRNTVHDWSATGAAIAVRGGVDIEIASNRLYGGGATGTGYAAIGLGGSIRTNVHHNYITAGVYQGTSSFRDIEPIFESNEITGPFNRGMECDTDYAPSFSNNTIYASAGFAGIDVEVSPYAKVLGNTIDGAQGAGINLFGRALVDQVLLNSAESAWTCPSNVTCTTDTSNKKVGSSSAKMAIASGFTSGTIAYALTASETPPPPPPPQPQATDISGYGLIRLWIEADQRVLPGTLAVQVGHSLNLSDNVDREPLPGLYPNQWVQVYIPMRVYWNRGEANGMMAISSVGIVALSTPSTKPLSIWIDDVEVESVAMRYKVTENQILNTGTGIILDQIVNDSDLSFNTIQDMGLWTTSGSGGTGIQNATLASNNNRIVGNTIRSQVSAALGNQIGIDERATNTLIEDNTVIGFATGQAIIVCCGSGSRVIGNQIF